MDARRSFLGARAIPWTSMTAMAILVIASSLGGTWQVGNIALAASRTPAIHLVPGKLGPISIRTVYTTDSNHDAKSVFDPGDKIEFHVDVDNTTQDKPPIDVNFDLIDNDNSWSGNYSYEYTQHVAEMPLGLTRFYNPTTIPPNAYNGRYSIRITISPTNSSSPANDGDWAEGDFHIFSTKNVNPINEQIKALQNGALCAGTIVSGFGPESLLLESVKTGVEAMGFFKDVQTGKRYWAVVNLAAGGCIDLVKSALHPV